MANQANTSMADRQEQKIKDCHSTMVICLGKHFHPKLQDNWDELLERLSKFLGPVDLQGKDNSFIKICHKLMAQEIIDYGSYDKLYEVIKKIDAEPAKIIQKTSEEIKDIKSKGTPTVETLEANYTALIGERVELKCSVAAIPWITSVSWHHILPGGQSVQLSIDQRKYKGSIPYDPHLVINELMKDDEGEYVCTVSNVCGKGQSAPTKLTIKGGPPTLTMNPTRYWKTEGEIAIFKCTVIAKPPAFAIAWSKEEEGHKRKIAVDENKYIGGSLISPSLIIADLEKTLDEGKYVCEAENIAGIGSNSVYLTINSKTANTETISRDPDKPRTTFAEKSRSIMEYAQELVRPYGNLTDFGVEYGLDIRKVNVRFTVQEDIIHLKESFQRLLGQMLGVDYRIVNVQMSKGCTIVSFDITGATHPLDESALALAERFTTGLKDGSILLTDETGNTLQIQQESIKITMKETLDAAADIDVPMVSIDQAAYYVVIGDKANLKSRLLTSTPITSVTWFRIDNENGTEHAIVIDNKKYFGGSVESPSLVIDNTKVEDTGRFVCHAENRCGVGKSFSTALCIYNSDNLENVLALQAETSQRDSQPSISAKTTDDDGSMSQVVTKKEAPIGQKNPTNMAVADQNNSYGVEREYRIVLIGRTGSGKSATANNILGKKAFMSKLSGSSVTKRCEFHTAERFGKKLVVVDTPGLFDTTLTNDVVTKEIIKCIAILTPGPHVFILVVQVGRITPEEQDTITHFSQIFGKEFFRYLIVLFTRRDDLENNGATIQEYVNEVPEELKIILRRCGHKYLAFDNTPRGTKTDFDVLELMRMVETIINETGKSYFSNDIFERSELEFQRRAKEIRLQGEEKIALLQKKIKKEMEAQKRKFEEQKREIEAKRVEIQAQELENLMIEKKKHETSLKLKETLRKKQAAKNEMEAKRLEIQAQELENLMIEKNKNETTLKLAEKFRKMQATEKEMEAKRKEIEEREIEIAKFERKSKLELEKMERKHGEDTENMRDKVRKEYEREDKNVFGKLLDVTGSAVAFIGKSVVGWFSSLLKTQH